MARRRDDRDRPAAPGTRDGSDPAVAPVAGGPRDFVVEEERLADGRYVLYYGWSGPQPAASAAPSPQPAAPPPEPARKPRPPKRRTPGTPDSTVR
jgi:hypothetical protein